MLFKALWINCFLKSIIRFPTLLKRLGIESLKVTLLWICFCEYTLCSGCPWRLLRYTELFATWPHGMFGVLGLVLHLLALPTKLAVISCTSACFYQLFPLCFPS